MSRRLDAPLARALWPTAALVALVLLVWFVGSVGGDATDRTATLLLVNLVVVVGLSVFVGNSGVFSFGHIAFMAIGAYVVALATVPQALKLTLLDGAPHWLQTLELSTPVALLAGGAAAALFAALASVPIMRLAGIAAGIATLALLVTVNVVLSNWDGVTRGSAGMIGVPVDTTLSSALPWAIGAVLAAAIHRASRSGFRLRASREDDVAALSLGVGVRRERRIAFVLSAFLCGVGGGLYAHFLGAATPGDFYIPETVLTLLMLVIGGMESLAGAVVGTIFVSIVAELLRRVESGGQFGPVHIGATPGIQQIVLALLLLATLILRPQGLTGGREIPWPGRRRRPGAGPDSAAAPLADTQPVEA